MKHYDLFVVGTGPAGSLAAFQAREAGLSVAIADKKPLGGTCALRGCNPKKVLYEVTSLIDQTRRLKGLGIDGEISINWKDMMEFKRTFTRPVPKSSEESYHEAGMEIYRGAVSFNQEDQVRVNDEIIGFDKILLAAGARPMPLNIRGGEHLADSADFLELDELPKQIVLIGGGFISFEFAHIAALSGSEVHIIELTDRPLRQFDGEAVALLMKRSEELGIKIHLNTKPLEIEKTRDRYIVHAKNHNQDIRIGCDRVFHGAGRVPDTAGLALEKGNVTYDNSGIAVNEFFQSVSNERVYAAGDVTLENAMPLTPVAEFESDLAIQNIIKGNHKKADYGMIPSILFTQPELAMIGLTQEKAEEDHLDVSIQRINIKEWTSYQRTNEAYAMAKTITDKKSGKLLGVHILGRNADQLINLFSLMMNFHLSPEKIKNTLFAFPTAASDFGPLLP